MSDHRLQFFTFFKPEKTLTRLRAELCLLTIAACFQTATLSATEVAPEPMRILFFGDSLTAGYGIDPALAYPSLIQTRIDAADIHAKITVGAVSGDTSAGGLRRIDWMLRQPVDIFVLALGGNDGLRGVDPNDTRQNLQAIIEKVLAQYPEAKVVIAGMRLPPSLGKEYTSQFAAIYPELAEYNQATLIPFLLEGVGGSLELNLPDRIHPNPEGHKILAETAWAALEPLLKHF